MMTLEEYERLRGFFFQVASIEAHNPGTFPSLPGFVGELGDYIRAGEANPAPDLAGMLGQEFALRVEEELAEEA